MILNNFSARNWRAHSFIEVLFHPLSNLICGRNDAGKTSILKGIICCLTPGGRIGSSDDIRHGADEAELTLTLSVPSGSGYAKHTIIRRFNAKGKSSFEIDGEKVAVSRAIEILTVEWGLPHPEQLAGLIWLRQLRIDSLIREEPNVRQDRFRALLGYQLLKSFTSPIEKVIAQFNTAATSDRSLGVDPRELENELANTRTQIEAYERELSEILSPEEATALASALNNAIAQFDYNERAAIAKAAAQDLPLCLLPWIYSADPSPSLDRLSEYSRAKRQLSERAAVLAEMGDEKTDNEEHAYLSKWLIEQKRAELQKALKSALEALPIELHPWLKARRAHHANSCLPDGPVVTRLGDLAMQKRERIRCEAEIALLPSEADDEKLRLDLSGWIVQQQLILATNAVNAARAALPEGLHGWFDSIRGAFDGSRPFTKEERIQRHRSAGVINAAALIERNKQTIQAAAQNARLAKLKQTLVALLPAGAPDSEQRSICAQALAANEALNVAVKALSMGSSALNGGGAKLKAFIPVMGRASLIAALPHDSVGANGDGAWSHETEVALTTIWGDMNRTGKIEGECPLTGDHFNPDQIARAQAAQLKRKEAREASTQWQTFVKEVEKVDRELANMLVRGEVASATAEIRSAAAMKEQLLTEVAPANSPFWSVPAKRTEFVELHTKAEATRANASPEALKWLSSEAERRGVSPIAYLQSIRKQEEAIAAHGPELPVNTAPFDPTFETAVLAAQEAIVAYDVAAVNVLVFEKKNGSIGQNTCSAKSVAEAETKLAEITKRVTTRASLSAKLATVAESIRNLESGIFAEGIDPLSYVAVVNAFQDNPALIEKWAAGADAAFSAAKAVDDFENVNPTTSTSTNVPFAVPTTSIDAENRIALLEKKVSDRVSVKSQVSMLAKSFSDLENAVFNGSAELMASCEDLIKFFDARDSESINKLISAAATARHAEQEMQQVAKTFDIRFQWPATRFGDAPASSSIAKARLETTAQQGRDRAALLAKIEAARQNVARLETAIAKMAERKISAEKKEKIRDTFKAVEKFLQPENGPRVLMSQTFLQILDRANEILETIGADMWLVGNEDFQLFAGSPKHGDHLVAVEEEGGGKGYLCGTALALALLESYNETTDRAGVHTLLVDEPTIGVDKSLVPSLMAALTSKGRRSNLQTILVEHEPSGEAYCDHVIRID